MNTSTRTNPGKTRDGKPFDFYVQQQVDEGKLRLETIPADVLGLARPLEVYRAKRKGKFVSPWDRDDMNGYCPKH